VLADQQVAYALLGRRMARGRELDDDAAPGRGLDGFRKMAYIFLLLVILKR
jgi:hypothetical protein